MSCCWPAQTQPPTQAPALVAAWIQPIVMVILSLHPGIVTIPTQIQQSACLWPITQTQMEMAMAAIQGRDPASGLDPAGWIRVETVTIPIQRSGCGPVTDLPTFRSRAGRLNPTDALLRYQRLAALLSTAHTTSAVACLIRADLADLIEPESRAYQHLLALYAGGKYQQLLRIYGMALSQSTLRFQKRMWLATLITLATSLVVGGLAGVSLFQLLWS